MFHKALKYRSSWLIILILGLGCEESSVDTQGPSDTLTSSEDVSDVSFGDQDLDQFLHENLTEMNYMT